MNSLCNDCAIRGHVCPGTACPTYTGCTMRATLDAAYTIRLDGKYYAVAMDIFAHYVFGIGRDAGRVRPIERGTGTAGRNVAIRAICTPFGTWRDAYNVAKATGKFAGELYTD